MKKLFQILAIAATLVACSKDETVPVQGTYTLTGYTNVETKTDFGTPSGNTIPFEWSVGDFIWNGLSKSNLLTSGGSSATFTISGSEPAGTVYYNMTASNVREATTVKIPTEQDASKTLGQNGDFGYATVEKEGSFILKHATAYLWFDIEGLPSGSTLKSIRLHAGNTCVAGTAKFSSNKLNIVEGSGRSIVDLSTDISSVVNNAGAVMVLCPAELANATITYQLTKGSSTEDYLYYEQTFSGKELKAGVTSKISVNLANVELKESVIRTLTFEDVHAKYQPYETEFEYAMMTYSKTVTINGWSDFIPNPEENSGMQYGNGHNVYEWYDEKNTELAYIKYEREENDWGIAGHAGISNFTGTCSDVGDWDLYGYDLQVYNVSGGANSSINFCTHYGYKDPEEYETLFSPKGDLPGIQFYDKIPRVVDHMYVTNTSYAYEILIRGECDFGGSYEYTNESTFKIVAYGYDSMEDDNPTIAEFYLLNVNKQMVTDWTYWDLSILGKVVKIEFNLVACDNGYGEYGNVIPAYFAYDDVAVRFE